MNAWGICFSRPVRYADGVALQQRIFQARLADTIPDTVLFLEHQPVVTLGRRGRDQHLLVPPEVLKQRGVDLVKSSRGGDVTYHGPGQLVMYPILKLGTREADAHGYLENLEEVAIRTSADFGVRAFRRPGKSGAWTQTGKLAAIGFQIKRWVTLHGMSYNVDMDLGGFDLIVGCGLVGEPVASLRAILGERAPPLSDVRSRMALHFGNVCGRPLDLFDADGSMPAALHQLLGPVVAS